LDAKNRLQAAPYSLNPKHIVLLSDGEENVNPLYASVQSELMLSGVVIDTVGLSGDAPAALLSQIAADTGGTYRFVPTTGGTLLKPTEAQIAELGDLGLPMNVIESITTPMPPGPLGLDDVYDYLETTSQGATRLFHDVYAATAASTWKERSIYVDESANILRLVVAGKQPDHNGYDDRLVEILPPGANPDKGWIPVSPPRVTPPPNWDIRHSLYDDVVIITNPDRGIWKIRTLYYYRICLAGSSPQGSAPDAPDAVYDFMMNGSVQSDIRFEGRFLPPVVNNMGMAGDSVPIVATLLDKTGAIPGAVVVGLVEKPGAADVILLLDDGLHSDGAAGDGIYGTYYNQTVVGGSYNVRLVAVLDDPNHPDNWILREWLGAFWINGPEFNDEDKDGMPDPWEQRSKLNTQENDANADPDRDGLVNIDEFNHGTLPCDPDTDDGGEKDGSEVNNGRNPLWAPDDKVPSLGHIIVIPLNGMLRIQWTWPISYTAMRLYPSTDPDNPGKPDVVQDEDGTYTITNLVNGVPIYLTLEGENGTAIGAPKGPIIVTPKADPDPPSGAILINNGALATSSNPVILNISATDMPLPGIASPAGSSSPLS
jgi:hypothetical protein